MGEENRKKNWISMDESNKKGLRTNSSDKDAFFTFQFYLINLCFLGAGICGDNQDIANKKNKKYKHQQNK